MLKYSREGRASFYLSQLTFQARAQMFAAAPPMELAVPQTPMHESQTSGSPVMVGGGMSTPRGPDLSHVIPHMGWGSASVAPTMAGGGFNPSAGPSTLVAMTAGAGGQADSSTSFICACCKKTVSRDLGVAKGNQMWCLADNRSYDALCTRWAKSPKLKLWWQALTPNDKVSWFIRWQTMDPRTRFDAITAIERTVYSIEDVNDEIDGWVPFHIYFRDNIHNPGATLSSLQQEFKDIVERNNSTCRFHRGEWHVPVYQGLERRVRRRTAQEIVAQRSATITDRHQLNSIMQAGQQSLQRYARAVPQVLAAPTPLSLPAPLIDARQEDQPVLAEPRDMMMDAIGREVCGHNSSF